MTVIQQLESRFITVEKAVKKMMTFMMIIISNKYFKTIEISNNKMNWYICYL